MIAKDYGRRLVKDKGIKREVLLAPSDVTRMAVIGGGLDLRSMVHTRVFCAGGVVLEENRADLLSGWCATPLVACSNPSEFLRLV